MVVCLHAPIALARHKPAQPSGAAADAALSKKIGAHVDCINDHSNDVLHSRDCVLHAIQATRQGRRVERNDAGQPRYLARFLNGRD